LAAGLPAPQQRQSLCTLERRVMFHRVDPKSAANAALVVVCVLACSPALADGALAIGFPSNVTKDGFAAGFAYNSADPEKARSTAMERCRTTKSAPDSAKSLCMVIGTFRNECVAIAMDPKDGTPGVGFAIATDKETAEARALAFCAATAGKTRQGFCTIQGSQCDKSDKAGN